MSTRNNRGKVIERLGPSSIQLIEQNKNKVPHQSNLNFANTDSEQSKRQSRRTSKKENELFGGKLYLRMGEVSDLYRDIGDLYVFYINNKDHLSQTFPGMIRMSLRLLSESAALDDKKDLPTYFKCHYASAKATLDSDIKTTLSNLGVSEGSIIQLLHTGAHKYQSSKNLDQTIAMSIIIGAVITITHGQ